jgi:hypothetical protein
MVGAALPVSVEIVENMIVALHALPPFQLTFDYTGIGEGSLRDPLHLALARDRVLYLAPWLAHSCLLVILRSLRASLSRSRFSSIARWLSCRR